MASKPKLVAEQQFTIIKDAPPPRVGVRRKYPFPDMEIGDAFDLPMAMKTSVANASWQWGKVNNRKFSVRTIDENTIRCWRIA